jgi:hypothetical protein
MTFGLFVAVEAAGVVLKVLAVEDRVCVGSRDSERDDITLLQSRASDLCNSELLFTTARVKRKDISEEYNQ